MYDIPALPEWDDSNYHTACTKPYIIETGPFRVMDNALDIAHFPFLHDGRLGYRENPEIPDYKVTLDKDGLTMWEHQYETSQHSSSNKDKLWVNWFNLTHPLWQRGVSESSEMRKVDLLLITPVDEDNSILRYLITWSGLEKTNPDIVKSTKWLTEYDKTTDEDIFILNSQQPKRLPLFSSKWMNTQGLPHEVHMPSDRCTLTYRKWIKELNITYGVC